MARPSFGWNRLWLSQYPMVYQKSSSLNFKILWRKTMTKSLVRGKSTSVAEILNISAFGVWLLVEEKEYFASYNDFPWFRDAKVSEILTVEIPNPGHLYWPLLDIDLAIESLECPEKFPLISKTKRKSK
jgi:hypothetical protein